MLVFGAFSDALSVNSAKHLMLRLLLPLLLLLHVQLLGAAAHSKIRITFTSLGCFRDSDAGRDLDGLEQVETIGPYSPGSSPFIDLGDSCTPQLCAHVCAALGFRYFGTQNGNQCFCGNSFGRHGQVSISECGTPCRGDATRMCGSGWRNLVQRIVYTVGKRSFLANKQPWKVDCSASGMFSSSSTLMQIPQRGRVACVAACSRSAGCLATAVPKSSAAATASKCHFFDFAALPKQLDPAEFELWIRN